jgi:hypothetical protein
VRSGYAIQGSHVAAIPTRTTAYRQSRISTNRYTRKTVAAMLAYQSSGFGML